MLYRAHGSSSMTRQVTHIRGMIQNDEVVYGVQAMLGSSIMVGRYTYTTYMYIAEHSSATQYGYYSSTE